MKIRMFAVATVALAALGGCATYDYVDGSAPGGYYSGQPRVEYYGGYGYPYGGYGSYGGYGYYGYPYGYYRPPYGYYPPYYHGHHHPRPNPWPGGGTVPPSHPPVGQRPDSGRAPWRDLDRVVEQNRPPRQIAPQARPVPQVTAPPRSRPAPRPSGGGRMSQLIERTRQAQQEP